MGQDPEARLGEARASFASGANDTVARATAVADLIAGAAGAGRGRVLIAIVGADVLFGVVVVATIARRRRRRRPTAMAQPGPYATLAAPFGAGPSGTGSSETAEPEETLVAEAQGVGEASPGPDAGAGHLPDATEPIATSEPPLTGDAS
jgi:hypothetical protein